MDTTVFEALTTDRATPGMFIGVQRRRRAARAQLGAASVVCGQQVHLNAAFGMRRRLVEKAGIPVDGGLTVPPGPVEAAALVRADRLLKSAPAELHHVTMERLTIALCLWLR